LNPLIVNVLEMEYAGRQRVFDQIPFRACIDQGWQLLVEGIGCARVVDHHFERWPFAH
jgi:hypothetical protein